MNQLHSDYGPATKIFLNGPVLTVSPAVSVRFLSPYMILCLMMLGLSVP